MKRNYSLILILMFALGLWGCAERSEARPVGTGLFSWKAQAFQEGRGKELLEWMAERDISALYQAISGDEEKDIIQEFLRNAADRKIAVYLLTGDPEWGMDPSGKPMIEAVERAARSELPLFPYENERTVSLRAAIGPAQFRTAAIMTGPEGGFSEDEVRLAEEAGMKICSLGPRILRCETAPLCALSAVLYAAGALE